MNGWEKIPDGLREYARWVARLRVEANRSFYSGTFRERPDPEETEVKGILAELIVRHRADISGRPFEVSAFVKLFATADADIIRDRRRFDVKASTGVLRANKRTLDRAPIDAVIFVVIRGEEYRIVSYGKEEVQTWGVVGGRMAGNEWYEKEEPGR